jgi:hypothetical protein
MCVNQTRRFAAAHTLGQPTCFLKCIPDLLSNYRQRGGHTHGTFFSDRDSLNSLIA